MEEEISNVEAQGGTWNPFWIVDKHRDKMAAWGKNKKTQQIVQWNINRARILDTNATIAEGVKY